MSKRKSFTLSMVITVAIFVLLGTNKSAFFKSDTWVQVDRTVPSIIEENPKPKIVIDANPLSIKIDIPKDGLSRVDLRFSIDNLLVSSKYGEDVDPGELQFDLMESYLKERIWGTVLPLSEVNTDSGTQLTFPKIYQKNNKSVYLVLKANRLPKKTTVKMWALDCNCSAMFSLYKGNKLDQITEIHSIDPEAYAYISDEYISKKDLFLDRLDRYNSHGFGSKAFTIWMSLFMVTYFILQWLLLYLLFRTDISRFKTEAMEEKE